MAMAWSGRQAIQWISGTQFDGGTKTVGHLIVEDRQEDIDDQLGKLLRPKGTLFSEPITE
jgi:hypothetical protein